MTALSTLHTPAADQSTTQRCSICQGMEPELHRQLQRLGRIKRYAAGEIIVGEEEEAPFVGTVTSGVLRMQKTLYDGRQLIVGLLMPSDMFGRVFSSTSNVSIEAATDVTLCCYSRAGFEILLSQFPALEHRMSVAVRAMKSMSPKEIVVGLLVASSEAVRALGDHYLDFRQMSDEDVIAALRRTAADGEETLARGEKTEGGP